MPTLREVYEEVWRERWGLNPNWNVHLDPSSDALTVGEVGILTDANFDHEKTLSDIGVDFDLDSVEEGREGREWTFQSSDQISVETAVKLEGQVPSVPWLGDAEAGLEIKFGSEEGAVAMGESLTRHHVGNVDNLRGQLINAYSNGALAVGHAIIIGVQVTGEGSIFISRNGESSARITGKAALLDSGFSPLKGEASLGFKKLSGGCTQQGLESGSAISFRALQVVEKGILWWKRVEIRGAVETTADDYAALMALEATEDDYFAVFE